MTTALAIERYIPVPGDGLNARLAMERTTGALRKRVSRISRPQRIVAISVLVAVLVAAAGAMAGPRLVAYLGVFGSSVVANAVLFLPSGRGAIMVGAALVLNPLAVAVLTGAGGALGEITGYALGRSSRKLVKRGSGPAWLSRKAESHMAITILAVSIIPNPFVDVIGIVAGRKGYPVRRFLIFSAVGKVVQSIAFVYLALWNLSLLSSVTGIEL